MGRYSRSRREIQTPDRRKKRKGGSTYQGVNTQLDDETTDTEEEIEDRATPRQDSGPPREHELDDVPAAIAANGAVHAAVGTGPCDLHSAAERSARASRQPPSSHAFCD